MLILSLVLVPLGISGPLNKDLSLSLEARQVEKLTQDSCHFVFYINIANASSKPYLLIRYRYRFMVEDKEYLQLNKVLAEGLEVSPLKSTLIAIPVKITYQHLYQTLEEARGLDKASCYIMGELFFGDGRKERGSLPIAYSGEFPIFKTPSVQLIGLQANSVSLGGADLDFKFKLVNGNSFDLRVDEMNYILKMDNLLISQGRIEGDKDVSGNGEKVFSLRLLINYFDVGKDVHAVLQKEEVLLFFEGTIEFRTRWGRMTVPFENEEGIVLSKLN